MRVEETINIPTAVPTSSFPIEDMIGQCEGLILLCGINYFDPILLLNPATQELKTLPQSSVERPPDTNRVYFTALGLGYDCCTTDYKVVRFAVYSHYPEGYPIDQVELYTLSSNSWRPITNPFGPVVLRQSRFNIYLNGHCHWWLTQMPYEGEKILAFDMTQETFKAMELPSCSEFIFHWLEQEPELRVFCNYLAVFAHSRENMDCFEIWVMKEYGVMESWTKRLVIGPIAGLGGVRELLGMWKTGEWFFKTNERRLALFNPHTKSIKDLEIHHCPNARSGLMLSIFTESLFSLNGR
ncbi:F-box protein CPR1-like [Tripterygium wilfordii]|uniref:F-box protein CPR1-like n=1 Tax=Tripterygium wilfordii TaxID=458696 RepID=UPI0018F828D7|nr:F-box protein CPR1-like [Tripterygium wilfordii]